jgi:hypothetical protein
MVRVWQRVDHGEKMKKMPTFGARGFVLESAMTDDDDEMRVVRGERTVGRGSCVLLSVTNLGDL